MPAAGSYWVHDLSPFLIRFPDNPLGIEGIRYYGLSYLLGFAGAWLLLRIYDQKGKFQIDADARATLMTAIMIGVLVGGRIGYMLLYDFAALVENPLLILRVDQGGMASHGGFAGVFIAVFWFARRQKYGLLEIGDVVVTLAPLGLMFGRIANFINGELWGKVSTVPWAMIFPDSPYPRHPSQLYQAALEGALLLAYTQWRFWKGKAPAGQIGGEFLIGYGIVRIIGEIFREPDAGLLFGLSRGQFYSIIMIFVGAFIINFARQSQRKQSTGT